jgi:hypothetical protein
MPTRLKIIIFQDFLDPAKISDLEAEMNNLEAFLIKKKLEQKPFWLGETASGQSSLKHS